MNSTFNRNARRSGGDPHARITVGESIKGRQPIPSIQCYEGRHTECTGRNTLFPGSCECRCHTKDRRGEHDGV